MALEEKEQSILICLQDHIYIHRESCNYKYCNKMSLQNGWLSYLADEVNVKNEQTYRTNRRIEGIRKEVYGYKEFTKKTML